MIESGEAVSRTQLVRTAAIAAAAFIIGLVFGYSSFKPVQRIFYNLRRLKADTLMEQWLDAPLPHASMVDLNGKRWEPADEVGRVLVLVFWSVSCTSCLDDLQKLNAVYNEFRDRADFSMVGIPRQQEIDLVAFMSARKGVNWPQAFELDSNTLASLAAKLGIRRIPSIWVVDRKGIIRGIHVTSDQLQAVLDDILNL